MSLIDQAMQYSLGCMRYEGQPVKPSVPAVVTIPKESIEAIDRQFKDHAATTLTVATKYDAGKTQWNLLPWDSVEEVVKVMEFGAGKYNPFNWVENGGFKYSRLFNSSMRHFIAWFWKKEDNDPETGLSHLAHLSCNVFFLLHYVLNKEKFTLNDDRR